MLLGRSTNPPNVEKSQVFSGGVSVLVYVITYPWKLLMNRGFALKLVQSFSTSPAARNRQPVIVDVTLAAASSVIVTFEPMSAIADASEATSTQSPVSICVSSPDANVPPWAPPTSARVTSNEPPTLPSLQTVIWPRVTAGTVTAKLDLGTSVARDAGATGESEHAANNPTATAAPEISVAFVVMRIRLPHAFGVYSNTAWEHRTASSVA